MSSLAVPKLDWKAQVKRINWRKVLIGDLNRIDVFDIFWRRAWDIVLCGVGCAFLMLIIASAYALPEAARAVVWTGCAVLFVLVVDRPSWNSLMGFAILSMVFPVGAVTISSVIAGNHRDVTLYFALETLIRTGFPIGYSMVIALSFGAYFIPAFVEAIVGGSPTDAQAADKRAVKRTLKDALGYRNFWWDCRYFKNGDFELIPFRRHRRARIVQELGAIRQALGRDVEITTRGGLLVHPAPAPTEVILHD